MSQLSEVLNRIAELYPETIKPGLTIDKIEQYLDDLPAKLPEEFYELYQLTDGLDHSNPATLIFGYGDLYSLSRAVELYNEMQEYSEYYPKWLPITSVEDLVYVIRGDFQQQKTAPIIIFDYGDLIYDNDREPKIIYQSLTDMILDYVDSLENHYDYFFIH